MKSGIKIEMICRNCPYRMLLLMLFYCFFPQDLREEKMKEFVNIKIGNMFVKEYTLKFHQLSRYALIW